MQHSLFITVNAGACSSWSAHVNIKSQLLCRELKIKKFNISSAGNEDRSCSHWEGMGNGSGCVGWQESQGEPVWSSLPYLRFCSSARI